MDEVQPERLPWRNLHAYIMEAKVSEEALHLGQSCVEHRQWELDRRTGKGDVLAALQKRGQLKTLADVEQSAAQVV